MDKKMTYGLTSWDEVELKNNSFQKQKDLYMRLENGSNVLRVVTKPHQYRVHQNFKEKDAPGFGDRVMCSSFHGTCPACDKGDKAKNRWLLGVIDRRSTSFKILDISPAVFKGIQELSRDQDYGDPGKYDIDVKVDKQGGATGYYTIIPKPPRALSAQDVDIKSKIDTDDLVRRCSPPTPEKVQERLDGIAKRKAAKTGGAAASVAVSDSSDSSDEETFDFPPANV